MFQISRRDLVLSSVGAGLAFGLDKQVSFIGAAQAQRGLVVPAVLEVRPLPGSRHEEHRGARGGREVG